MRGYLLAAIVGLFVSGVAQAELSSDDHAAIERACTDLVFDYAYYRDRPDAAGFAGVFAQDGVLRVMGKEFTGREALYERLVESGDGPAFRHMMSTICIFPQTPTTAKGVSYVTVYSGLENSSA